jgi:tetratricopeptide (TPR) repeat protein
MCNYGLFLSEEMKNFSRAEQVYTRALDMFPNHANTLYNYAVMLDSHCGRKEEAEKFYRRCIEVEPRHSFALYNLAVLREEVLNKLRRPAGEAGGSVLVERGDPLWDNTAGEVFSFYQRALEADPRDATTMADCGR